MDMVHPSSDMRMAERENLAHLRPTAAAPEIETDDSAETSGSADEAMLMTEFHETFKPNDEVIEPSGQKTSEARDEYTTPFMTNVKLEKTPLSAASPTGLKASELDSKKLLEDPHKNELALPSDDRGTREPELRLPAHAESVPEPANHLRDHQRPESMRKHRYIETNDMIMPQYRSSDTAQIIEPNGPFGVAAREAAMNPVKKGLPAWGIVLLVIILITAGIAVGAWLYSSGLLS
jgi:hypothetical protein